MTTAEDIKKLKGGGTMKQSATNYEIASSAHRLAQKSTGLLPCLAMTKIQNPNFHSQNNSVHSQNNSCHSQNR
ncbi:MAG: hypothetical protein KF900_13890 [Bacteroidetes bacterium]|nr:hypothetical protein [Bacteroidota bacterium]